MNRRAAAGIFYFHPWEVDPGQPRVADCGWKSRFRHYTNLSRMAARLDRLLRDFAWDRMDRVFAEMATPQRRTFVGWVSAKRNPSRASMSSRAP